MLRKFLWMTLAAVMCLSVLSACQGKPMDYDDDLYNAGGFGAAIDYARSDDLDRRMMFPVHVGYPTGDSLAAQRLSFSAGDVREMASAVDYTMSEPYAIVLVRPENGRAETVRSGLQLFLRNAEEAMAGAVREDYAAIVEYAILETLPDGSYILAMCEDADVVYQDILSYLNGTADVQYAVAEDDAAEQE